MESIEAYIRIVIKDLEAGEVERCVKEAKALCRVLSTVAEKVQSEELRIYIQ